MDEKEQKEFEKWQRKKEKKEAELKQQAEREAAIKKQYEANATAPNSVLTEETIKHNGRVYKLSRQEPKNGVFTALKIFGGIDIAIGVLVVLLSGLFSTVTDMSSMWWGNVGLTSIVGGFLLFGLSLIGTTLQGIYSRLVKLIDILEERK